MAVRGETREYTGKEKAAMLLITLGPERSAQIFKHLKEDEIEQLTLEIANIRSVSPQDKNKVLEEFYQICLAQEYIAEGGIGYAKDILEKALGTEKTMEIINKLTVSLQVRPFDFVRKADPSQVLNFIQSEHPQTIALILAYLKPQQAAVILSSLPQDKQPMSQDESPLWTGLRLRLSRKLKECSKEAFIACNRRLYRYRRPAGNSRYIEFGRPRN